MTAVAQALGDGWTVTRRNLIKVKRVPDLLVGSIISPIMFVLLFAFVFGGSISLPGAPEVDPALYRQFLIAGIFAQTMIFGATITGSGMAQDLKTGIIDRFRSLPMAPSAVLIGRTTADVVNNVLTVLIMTLTGLVVGWRVTSSFGEALLGYVLLLFFAYCISWLMAYVGMLVRTPEVFNNASFIVIFPLTFIANTFVPSENLPGPLQDVRRVEPGVQRDAGRSRAVRQHPAGHATADRVAAAEPGAVHRAVGGGAAGRVRAAHRAPVPAGRRSVTSAAAASPDDPGGLTADARASLDGLLRQWERERDLSGTVLITAGGTTVFEGCYGLADRAAGLPVTPRTRFGLASLTKSFTAVAVADLVTAGRLGFHDAVVDVLPPQRRPATLRPDVTVHHLLTHTSGIADYAEEDEDCPGYVADYGSLWVDRPAYRMLRPADFLPLFGDRPPYRGPGERWQYSNAGYVVLGLVVEEVAGSAYTEVVQERVFDRAGMTASGFFRLDEARPDVAVGYLPRSTPDEPWRTNIYSVPVIGGADGGAFSTARDLDLFLRRIADGSLLGAAQEAVLARHADAGDGFWFGYGLVHHPDGRFGHGGGDPGVEVIVHRFPDDDAHLVVLCNGEGLLDDVRAAVLAAWRG